MATLQVRCRRLAFARGGTQRASTKGTPNESEPKTKEWSATATAGEATKRCRERWQNYERYLARAREAKSAGDEVEMENCYQHAEHYLRIMRGTGDDQRY